MDAFHATLGEKCKYLWDLPL